MQSTFERPDISVASTAAPAEAPTPRWLALVGRRPSLIHLPLILGAAIMLLPFYWMITTALKSLEEASAFPPTLWPAQLLWENFPRAWQAAPFGRYFLNTILVAVGQMTAVVVSSSLAA